MGDRLPAASRVLLWMGQTIDSNPAAVAALLGTALILAVALWRTGRAARFAVRSLARIPRVRRVLIASEMARLYRTLALLLHGGIPLAKALLITRGLVGSELQKRIGDCQRSIAEGKSFSAGMRDHELSTPVADRFFRVGERTGRLSDMMDRAAEFHEGEVARSAELLTRVIGPVLMLAIGAVIGLVVVLMYLPIFQLADAIR
jgi:general secretion pathway protein F